MTFENLEYKLSKKMSDDENKGTGSSTEIQILTPSDPALVTIATSLERIANALEELLKRMK